MDDLKEIRKRIEIINSELGDVRDDVAVIQGEMKWIRYLLMGILASAIGQFFI